MPQPQPIETAQQRVFRGYLSQADRDQLGTLLDTLEQAYIRNQLPQRVLIAYVDAKNCLERKAPYG